MACNSCGKGQILKVERAGSGRSSTIKTSTLRFGSRKPITKARSVATKPANDLDKHRA